MPTPPAKRRQPAAQDVPARSFLAALERRAPILAVLLVLLASARIAATYAVYNHTTDEPAHIGAGMQWIDRGVYTYEPQHPPLARVAAALGPYLLGIRSQGTPGTGYLAESVDGAKILYSGDHYDLTLAVSRLGILPFFWIACWVVFIWGKRTYGAAGAAIALLIFTFLPPILAHAGLATTDMALTAFLSAAFLTSLTWAAEPSWKRGTLFGLCTGLAVISKFSALVFFPAAIFLAAVGYLAAERPAPAILLRWARRSAPSFLLALAAGALVILAIYRFSFTPVLAGIREVAAHNAEGHPTYLLGAHSNSGFWYFYPVVLAVKTPLALLALLGAACWLAGRQRATLRRHLPVLAFAAGILLVGLFSRINIGVRHILPVYVSFSLLAGSAVTDLAERARTHAWIRAALVILLVWLAGSSLLSHPDYLPYTNALAGSAPEKVLADSDLDWGQDMKRLGARLRQLGAPQVTFAPFVLADFEGQLGFPRVLPGNAIAPQPGWNAVSISFWKTRRLGLMSTHPEITPWPDRIDPGERVGKGVLLWYFPPR